MYSIHKEEFTATVPLWHYSPTFPTTGDVLSIIMALKSSHILIGISILPGKLWTKFHKHRRKVVLGNVSIEAEFVLPLCVTVAIKKKKRANTWLRYCITHNYRS